MARAKDKVLVSNRNWKAGHLYLLYVVLVMVFFYAPILSLIVFSFNSEKSATRFGSFTLEWYQQLFMSSSLMDALYVTVMVAVLATIISTIVGTLGAIGLADLSKSHKNFTNFVLNVNNLPVVNPDIVTAVSLMVLFMAVSNVLPMGFTTMLLAHIAFCTPYVVIQVYPKVLALDPSLMEAAMDLGASRRQAILKIVIPELMPAILSGSLMAFTMSFDDFIISYFVGGQTQNISIFVYTMKKFNPIVNALSAILFLIITVVLITVQIIKSKSKNFADDDAEDNKNAKTKEAFAK